MTGEDDYEFGKFFDPAEMRKMEARVRFDKERVRYEFAEFIRHLMRAIASQQPSASRSREAWQHFQWVMEHCDEQVTITELLNTTIDKIREPLFDKDGIARNSTPSQQLLWIAMAGLNYLSELSGDSGFARARSSKAEEKLRNAVEYYQTLRDDQRRGLRKSR